MTQDETRSKCDQCRQRQMTWWQIVKDIKKIDARFKRPVKRNKEYRPREHWRKG